MEFTVFVIGSSSNPESCRVFPPVETVFHSSLPEKEKFLSFDRLWELYENERWTATEEDFFTYQLPDKKFVRKICKLGLEAYCSVKGEGYGRIDMRLDMHTGKFYVLEVNAQCGLSDDEDYTSIGGILRLSGNSFASLVNEILIRAIDEKQIKIAV